MAMQSNNSHDKRGKNRITIKNTTDTSKYSSAKYSSNRSNDNQKPKFKYTGNNKMIPAAVSTIITTNVTTEICKKCTDFARSRLTPSTLRFCAGAIGALDDSMCMHPVLRDNLGNTKFKRSSQKISHVNGLGLGCSPFYEQSWIGVFPNSP